MTAQQFAFTPPKWGFASDYLTGQNVKRPCDRCEKKMGQLGGCYAAIQDKQLCIDCYNEMFDSPSLEEQAGWDA